MGAEKWIRALLSLELGGILRALRARKSFNVESAEV
jgi:hypothetical protein